MVLNDILINDKLNKFFNSCIGKTFTRYKLSSIMDMDDFYQESCIFIMNRIHNFDNNKSSIKTYLPLLIMTCGKRCIEKANGQSKEYSKIDFENNLLSLDTQYGNESDTNNLLNTLSDKNNDLEIESINRLLIEDILQSGILSKRQQEILKLMVKGYTQTDISKILKCSPMNINIHFKNAKKRILINYEK